ncbi:DUF5378 family protein [[Mycoplasma] testudinis]|uniref:DUF5378 family protein n=1 Tax=[Mycoplasma] testudinis TaxID=33924 RepID=UPI000480C159|nr:DUF5378 family protein [[Mycoplasma] testudinis]
MPYNTVEELTPVGRWVAVIVMVVIAIISISVILYLKKVNKVKMWFKPIGIMSPLYHPKRRIKLMKTDYAVWAGLAAAFLIYWFAGYFLVNVVLLAQYNLAVQQAAAHGGIAYVWNPSKITSSGSIGGYNAIFKDRYDEIIKAVNDAGLTGAAANQEIIRQASQSEQLMPYLTSQTNFNYYVFDVQNSIFSGTNLQNNSMPLLSLPSVTLPGSTDWSFIEKSAGGSNSQETIAYDINSPFYITTLYNSLSSANLFNGMSDRGYLDEQTSLWVHSFVYSNVFVTPLCQFLGMAFPVSLIMSRKKDYATFVAPWAFLGGAVTLFGGIGGENNIHVTPQFIFYDQQMFYLYHSFIFVVGFSWFFYSHRYSFASMTSVYLFMTGYMIWIVIVSHIFNIQYFTTGLTPLDMSVGGSYGVVNNDLLSDTLIQYPGNALLMFFVFASLVTIAIIVKNVLHYYYIKKMNPNLNDNYFVDLKHTLKLVKERIETISIRN